LTHNSTETQYSVRSVFSVYFILAALGSAGNLFCLLNIPTDQKSNWLFGFSKFRMGLAGVFIFLLFLAIWAGIQARRKPAWSVRVQKTFTSSPNLSWLVIRISQLVAILTIFLLLVPGNRFGNWQAYIVRLRPAMLLTTQISWQTILLIKTLTNNASWPKLNRDQIPYITMAGGVYILLLSSWGGLVYSGLGIQSDKWTVWYEVGVPILGSQVGLAAICAGLITILLLALKNLKLTQSIINVILFFSVWMLAFVMWQNTSFKQNYFLPKPILPGNEYYPFSDAASWDTNAQFALIGQGLANSLARADHAGYSGLLLIFHLLVGQDYEAIMTLQVGILSILPALLFWLGKEMYNRYLGLFLAGLAILHEINAILSSNELNLSHSKLLLTEFPSAVSLVGIALLMFLWLRKPHKSPGYAILLGGLLGLLIMFRFNGLVVFLAALVGIIMVFGLDLKTSLKYVAIVIISFLLVVSPWMWRSWSISGNPFFFTHQIALVFDSGFRGAPSPNSKANPLIQPKTTPVPSPTPTTLSTDQAVTTTAEQVEAGSPQPTVQAAQPVEPEFHRYGTVYRIFNYFSHNLITSVLILPTQSILAHFPNEIRTGTIFESSRYWRDTADDWLMDLPLIDKIAIAINLLILALGIAKAFQKWHLAGLIPMGIYLAYNTATALARNGGGRYIVPINWVVLLYFALGLLQLIWVGLTLFGFSPKLESDEIVVRPLSFTVGAWSLVPFVVFMLTITALDRTIPLRYHPVTTEEVLNTLSQEALLTQTDYEPADFEQFLQQPDALAFVGRGLYPRYFWARQGDGTRGYRIQPFSRLVLTTLSTNGAKQVILPLLPSPPDIFHAADVLIIGCRGRSIHEVEAAAVAVLGTEPQIFTRVPDPEELICPLSVPAIPKSIGH